MTSSYFVDLNSCPRYDQLLLLRAYEQDESVKRALDTICVKRALDTICVHNNTNTMVERFGGIFSYRR